jgi:hypothetical protein
MKIQSVKTTSTPSRKIITYSTEITSSDKAKSVQQEHISNSGSKEILNDGSKDDSKDSIPVWMQVGGGLAAPGAAYTLIQIPINTSPQELAKKLVDIGANPEDAIFWTKFLIEKISEPNTRNIIISLAAGIGFFTIIYKYNLPLWSKIALTILLISGLLYLTFTYLPHSTKQKDQLPSQESVNDKKNQ